MLTRNSFESILMRNVDVFGAESTASLFKLSYYTDYRI